MVPDLERSLSLAACDWRRELAEGRRSVLNQPFLGRSELPSLRRAQCFSFPPSLLLLGKGLSGPAPLGRPAAPSPRGPPAALHQAAPRSHFAEIPAVWRASLCLPDSSQKRERPASPASLPRGDREDGREPLNQRLVGCAPPPTPAGSVPRPAGSCVTRGLWQSGCGSRCVAASAPGAGGGPAGGCMVRRLPRPGT